MPDEPFTIAAGGLPVEGEARDGALTWQTLISADRTPSPSLVVGWRRSRRAGFGRFTGTHRLRTHSA
jgi:hypothetical protein